MTYRELPPPPDLAGHVQCLWSWQGESGGAPERIVPDGRCEVLLQLGDPYEEQGEDGAFSEQPRAMCSRMARWMSRFSSGTSASAKTFHP